MFYPVDSLKRGGRFYLCWVADSWPLRFATITHRQLWSQDVRKICDDLLDVMTTESGRPVNRFSLRLSSQLMRGLVRLYQRKVSVFLSDLCMINANVFKHTNKKWNIQEVNLPELVALELLPQAQELPEEPENAQRIEEMIQNSGNVVANVQDITLKEAVIPDFQLPPNDGFGEEHPDQALQAITDRTIEMMMQADGSNVQHSGLEVALDSTETHDKSRLQPHEIQMERISEHEITIFSKSAGAVVAPSDFEKDIPEIPDIPIPELPAPQTDKSMTIEQVEVPPEIPQPQETMPPLHETVLDIVLEELEELEPVVKRRRKNKLIIDKKIKISADVMHVRIGNPDVELRCVDSTDDIIDIRLPASEYFRRPCHAGRKIYSNIANPLSQLFLRNLGVIEPIRDDREMEEALTRTSRRQHVSVLERIEEEAQELVVDQPNINISKNVTYTVDHPQEIPIDQPIPQIEVVDQPMPEIEVQQLDISELPTQKLATSQDRKRKSEHHISPKRRASGFVSFRLSQEMVVETEQVELPATETNKENIPENEQTLSQVTRQRKSLASMLQEAGLADTAVPKPVEESPPAPETRKTDTQSETPLGSLDRTKVSLGDSDVTTESARFIRDQWGTTGTMTKIMLCIKAGHPQPLNVDTLLTKGPVIAEYKKVIAARCFTSILKLKQHGFIIIRKDPETLEVRDILLGPRFDD